MAAPTPNDLGALLGQDFSHADEATDQAVAVLGIITVMASSYTRGQGFSAGVPNAEISAVILTASARLFSNTTGLLLDESEGPSAVSYRSAFTGWTVAELFVLNRFRVTAL